MWGNKAGFATNLSRTYLNDALNGKTAHILLLYIFLHTNLHSVVVDWLCKGLARQQGQRHYQFLELKRGRLRIFFRVLAVLKPLLSLAIHSLPLHRNKHRHTDYTYELFMINLLGSLSEVHLLCRVERVVYDREQGTRRESG